MENPGIIDFGDLRIIPYKASPENCINSMHDFLELNTKIERRLKYYSLRSFLLKIHDLLLEHHELEEMLPFIGGIMSKYVILNSDTESGWLPVFDEEFLYFFYMIISCSLYDPEFEEESQHDNDDFASLLLKKIGSQVRWNIPHHNMWGRTLYIWGELIKSDNTPEYIKRIVTSKFEEKFGLSIIDFIKLGFIVYCRSQQPGYMNREYFESARMQKISIPTDEKVTAFLEQVSVDPLTYRKKCAENAFPKNYPIDYKLNPLFIYPLIRILYSKTQRESTYDEFIAPIPNLLIYRFTTGLYHQLYNEFGKKTFSDSFGYVFEHYVEKLLQWCRISGKVVPERDIISNLQSHKKKGQHIKTPDWIILCDEGIILLECKATKYSQSIYEHGLDAKSDAKGCIKQLSKGINQLNSFEQFIPEIIRSYGVTYKNLQIQKVIITFEPLVGQNEGPLRSLMNIGQGHEKDCKIIWVWYLEEIQPYLAKVASFWSFLIKYPNIEFNAIINEMEAKTGASYSDSVLYNYECKLLDELLKDT